MSPDPHLINHSLPEISLIVQDFEKQKTSRQNHSPCLTFEGLLADRHRGNAVTGSEKLIINNRLINCMEQLIERTTIRPSFLFNDLGNG